MSKTIPKIQANTTTTTVDQPTQKVESQSNSVLDNQSINANSIVYNPNSNQSNVPQNSRYSNVEADPTPELDNASQVHESQNLEAGIIEQSQLEESQNPEQVSQEDNQKEENQIDPAQLDRLLKKLNNTENKINNFKRNVESDKGNYKDLTKDVTKKTRDLSIKSDNIIQGVKTNKISEVPDLEKQVHDGLESHIVKMGTEIHKLREQQSELIETIKNKNIYINTIHEDFQKYRLLSQQQAKEIEELKKLIADKDKAIHKLSKKVDSDDKAQDARQNARDNRVVKNQIPKENAVKKVIQSNNNTKDPYDFWKTSNDEDNEPVNLDNGSESKLTAVLGKHNKLWLEKLNQELNFDSIPAENSKRVNDIYKKGSLPVASTGNSNTKQYTRKY